MRVNPQLARYNYSLIAHNVGLLAAELGDKIAEVASENPQQAQYLTGLLLYQVHPALSGQPGVRDSGLLNFPNVGAHAAFIKQVNDRVQEISVAAVNLTKSAGGLIPKQQKELSNRVAMLRAFLGKSAPADRRLLPNGPEFPLANPVAASPVLADGPSDPPAAIVPIPEVREYPRINAEVVRHLDAGHARVILAGAEGHRLLLHGLTGPWNAVVEVEGHAGPELAAEMNAPGLIVVCRGPVADGAARDLREGRVIILGDAGDALAYSQRGGAVLVAGSTGHRAGLGLVGGSLVLLGAVGRLAGERQAAGRIYAVDGQLGPHPGLVAAVDGSSLSPPRATARWAWGVKMPTHSPP